MWDLKENKASVGQVNKAKEWIEIKIMDNFLCAKETFAEMTKH